MIRTYVCPTLCALALSIPLTAHAEEAQPQPEAEIEPVPLGGDGPIVVTANRLPQDDQQPLMPVTILDDQTWQLAGQPWQPVTVIADQPGITLSQNGGIAGSSALRIRGATTAGTQVRYAGIPFNDPAATNSGPDLTLINPAAVSHIEILTGPQSGLYGSRAVGGVVDLQPLRPTADHSGRVRVQGGSFSTYDGLAQATGPIGHNAGYAVGIAAQGSDGITARTDKYDGDPGDFEEDGLELAGFYGRGEWTVMDGLTTFVSANVSESEVDYDSFGAPDSDNLYTETESTIIHAGAQYADDSVRPTLQAAADIALSQLDRKTPNAAFGGNDFQGEEWYIATRARWRPGDGPLVAGGIDWRREAAETTTVSDTTSVDESARHLGVWARAGWSVAEWEATATLRYENHSEEADAVTGQLQALAVVVPERFTVFASLGNAYRTPSLYELYALDDFGSGPIGNSELEPERSWGMEVGHRTELATAAQLEQTLFTTRYQERVGFDFASGYINQDDHVYVTGLDQRFVFGDLDTMHWQMTFAHVWQTVSNKNSDVAYRLPENEVVGMLSVQPHHDVTTSLMVTGVGSRSDFGGATLSTYTLIDLAVTWQVHDHVELFARGENITNQHYELADGFAQPGAAFYAGAQATW